MTKIEVDDNDIQSKNSKIALMKSDPDDSKQKLLRLKKKKEEEKPFRYMLKPDLIRACKERRLPFIGTRAHLISALVREKAAAKAVPFSEEKSNTEEEVRGCLDKAKELSKRYPSKILSSRDHGDVSGSIWEKEKLLHKNQKRMIDKVDLQMMKKKRKK